MEKEGQAELRLADNKLGAQGAERLARVLGQLCSSPAKLMKGGISGTTASERMASQCFGRASGTHLSLSERGL